MRTPDSVILTVIPLKFRIELAMANDGGGETLTLLNRLSDLVADGLYIGVLEYQNLNEYSLLDVDGNETPNTDDDPSLHQIQISIGYGGDHALQRYDISFCGVVNGQAVEDAFRIHTESHRGYPDLDRFDISSVDGRYSTAELMLSNHTFADDRRTIVASFPLGISFEFQTLNWQNYDALAMQKPETS